MALQNRPRAFIDHAQPGNHLAAGEVFLVGGINLPGVVGMLGSLPATALRPTGWGWSQVVLAQPALDRPRRGDFLPLIHPRQLDADAAGAPAGMLTAQLEDRFQ
jgi:hypothetical protein